MKDYKYPDYPAFKRDVLNKSVKEIMKHTEVKNLSFVVSEKIGRKVYKLKFSYTIGYEGDTRKTQSLLICLIKCTHLKIEVITI